MGRQHINKKVLTRGRTDHFNTKNSTNNIRHDATCIHSRKSERFSSCDRGLWRMNLTFELEVDSQGQQAKYLGQRSSSSSYCPDAQTHTGDRLLYLDH